MTMLAVLAFDARSYTLWSRHVTSALPQGLLSGIFIAAVVTHLLEALYAWRLAQRHGLTRSAAGWALQTFLLGYPSLRMLIGRARRGPDAAP
jgi:hypothetical protein